jgi:hypothetical protein
MKEAILTGIGEYIDMPEVIAVNMGLLGFGEGPLAPEGIDKEGDFETLLMEVKDHLVPIEADAPSCCMDGRGCIECMDGTKPQPRWSVAGGDLISAYAAAELIGWFPDEENSPVERLQALYDHLTSGGLVVGAHCDELAVAYDFKKKNDPNRERTGCTADDNFPTISGLTHKFNSEIGSFRASILGDDRHPTSFVSSEKLVERHATWRPIDMIHIVGDSLGLSGVEVLRADDTPTSGHREAGIIVSDIPGYDLDRDRFIEATGKNVFFVNISRLRLIARVMAFGPNAEDQEKQLLDALISYQFATLASVCDKTMPVAMLKSAYDLAA